MVKNIIFDVGGVIFDDKNNGLEKKFNISKEEADEITKIAFGSNFEDCMLGKIQIDDYIKEIAERYPNIKDKLEYILDPEYYNETFPLKEEVYKVVLDLYGKGYNLYILSNNTHASFNYVKNTIDLSIFKGVVSSFEEHLIKPNLDIYNLIIERYNLNKDETIFIDDSQRNVNAANSIGINSVRFVTVDDIIKTFY